MLIKFILLCSASIHTVECRAIQKFVFLILFLLLLRRKAKNKTPYSITFFQNTTLDKNPFAFLTLPSGLMLSKQCLRLNCMCIYLLVDP